MLDLCVLENDCFQALTPLSCIERHCSENFDVTSVLRIPLPWSVFCKKKIDTNVPACGVRSTGSRSLLCEPPNHQSNDPADFTGAVGLIPRSVKRGPERGVPISSRCAFVRRSELCGDFVFSRSHSAGWKSCGFHCLHSQSVRSAALLHPSGLVEGCWARL